MATKKSADARIHYRAIASREDNYFTITANDLLLSSLQMKAEHTLHLLMAEGAQPTLVACVPTKGDAGHIESSRLDEEALTERYAFHHALNHGVIRRHTPNSPTLELVYGGKTFPVKSGEVISIGRAAQGRCAIATPYENTGISRLHAQICAHGDEVQITAMGRHGTSVNNKELTLNSSHELHANDTIVLGTDLPVDQQITLRVKPL